MNNINFQEVEKSTGEDCRGLTTEFFKEFLPGGIFSAFVELVKNHSELQLCFRGNARPESVTIYHHNHKAFELKANGNISFDFNHARYLEDWKQYLEKLDNFDFKGRKIPMDGSIGELIFNVSKLKGTAVESIYGQVIKPIIDDFFDAAERKNVFDYFKEYCKKPQSTRRPARLVEKLRQHELFEKMTNIRSGYYFYDLEFQQKHDNKKEQDADKDNNKPDMLALKFDKTGKPEKLVIVEVKCRKAALKGKAGLDNHIKRMKTYYDDENRKQCRIKEAYLVLTQYAKLGLRNLNPDMSFDYKDFNSLGIETLVVLTDEARNSRLNAKKYNCSEYPEADFYIV